MALTVRTDNEPETALSALSEAEGASCQGIILRAALERFERTALESTVLKSASAMIDRQGDVLLELERA